MFTFIPILSLDCKIEPNANKVINRNMGWSANTTLVNQLIREKANKIVSSGIQQLRFLFGQNREDNYLTMST